MVHHMAITYLRPLEVVLMQRDGAGPSTVQFIQNKWILLNPHKSPSVREVKSRRSKSSVVNPRGDLDPQNLCEF